MGVAEREQGATAPPPPTFLTQVLGPPVTLKKGTSLLAQKRLYSQLFEANAAERTIIWPLEGSKKQQWNQFEFIKSETHIKWDPSKNVKCKQARTWLLEAPLVQDALRPFWSPNAPQNALTPKIAPTRMKVLQNDILVSMVSWQGMYEKIN